MSLTESVLNIIFSKYMIYLSPMLLLLMGVLFAERLIGLIYKAFNQKNNRWS